MNKQSAFIHEESDEKIVKENEGEKLKEVKRIRNCERQRAYYYRQKDFKKKEEKRKKGRKTKETVPKTNAERQREFRQRRKRQKLDSNEENFVQCRAVENIENVMLQENQFHSQQEVILHRNIGIPGDGTLSSRIQQMAELDKFKRRVIRAVARMLVKEKRPEDEVWEQLKKETGCDCKMLWNRMKALTLKKMNRLLLAEDRLKNVVSVAQMSLTDWLLFDLVLVHDDIDVIGEELQDKKTDKLSALIDLFMIVQRFEIEGKHGEVLANAWTSATFAYNSEGRQCSPMLLQRRWYQMKQSTRLSFYNFWFNYRGNPRLLDKAKEYMPNRLQKAIAQRYPHLITKPFMNWTECIEKKFVILPEEFEAKIRGINMANAPQKTSSEAPDIVLVAPNVETIEIGDGDSDTEKSPGHDDGKSTSELNTNSDKDFPDTGVRIKVEPADDIDIEETPFLTLAEKMQERSRILLDTIENQTQEIDGAYEPENVIDEININAQSDNDTENKVVNEVVSDAVESNVIDLNEDADNNRTVNDISVIDLNENVNKSVNDVSIIDLDAPAVDSSKFAETNDKIYDVYDVDVEKNTDLGSNIAESNTNVMDNTPVTEPEEQIVMPQITNVFGNVNVATDVLVKISNISIKVKEQSRHNAETQNKVTDIDLDPEEPMDIDAAINDKLNAYMKEANFNENPENNSNEKQDKKDEASSKDLTEINTEKTEKVLKKLKEDTENASITNPFIGIPTDLTFVDDGIELEDDGIAFVDDDDMITDKDNADSVNPEVIEKEDEESAKFDVKLLLQPVIYTTRLDDMTVLKNIPIDCLSDNTLLERVFLESKPKSDKTVDCTKIKEEYSVKKELFSEDDDDIMHDNDKDESSQSEEEEISEENKVNLSSYLLRKPRTRSYNPIQLCKNPDFNTRLKRLTVGFLSSTRNRSLLKTLKPMTIDVSKAFENKLINGTLYLKSCGTSPPVIKVEENIEQTSSVLPSAMPAQSLIDNINLPIKDILPPPSVEPMQIHEPINRYTVLPERDQSFNLPDIDKIRRMNRQIFTAEITPMSRQVNRQCLPPVHLISDQRLQNKDLANSCKETSSQDNHEQPKTGQNATSTEAVNDRSAGARNVRNFNKKPKYHYLSPFRTKPVHWSVNTLTHTPLIKNNVSTFDSLLTCDTLNKILHLLNKKEEDVIDNKEKAKKKRKLIMEQEKALLQRVEQFEKSLEQSEKPEVNADSEKEPPVPEPEPEPEKAAEKAATTQKVKKIPKPKVKVVKYKEMESCCWARLKLNGETKRRKHYCPRICQCCCRDELAKRTKKYASHRLIEISDDENEPTNKKVKGVVNNIYDQTKQTREIISATNSIAENNFKPFLILDNTPASQIMESNIQCNVNAISVPTKQQVAAPAESTDVITIDDSVDDDVASSPQTVSQPINTLMPNFKPKLRIKKSEDLFSKPVKRKIVCKTRTYVSSEKVLNLYNSISSRALSVQPQENKERIVYLKAKQKEHTKAGCPIFLGRNKILLTDGKLPDELAGTPVKTFAPPAAQPKVDMISPLPPGVQLVLLPNGSLTYSVDPDIEISAEQLATLPAILAAVQEKLNPAPIAAATNQSNTAENLNQTNVVINLDDNEKAASQPVDSIEMSKDVGNDPAPLVDPCTESIDKVPSESLPTEKDMRVDKLNSRSDSLNTVTEIINTQVENALPLDSVESAPDNVTNTSNDTEASNKISNENLESSNKSAVGVEIVTANNENDLKITENSTDPVMNNDCSAELPETEKQNTNNEPSESSRKTILSDLMAMSGISAEDTTPVVSEMPSPTIRIQHLAPVSPSAPRYLQTSINSAPIITTSPTPNIPELSSINSFAQLKYACENNGKFFKLDLETGAVTPINVCIKKNPSSKKNHTPNILTHNKVIDLTDDQEQVEQQEETSAEETPTKTRSLLRETYHLGDSVKPLKLFKSIKLKKYEAVKAGKASQLTEPEVTTSSSQSHEEKRKQVLTNHVRTDESHNLEEEDLSALDTSSLDEYIWKDSEIVSEGESSDDEPLALKAKRMRLNEITKEIADDQSKSAEANETNLPFESSDNIADESIADEPDILAEDGIDFCDPEDNESQEDCILGF